MTTTKARRPRRRRTATPPSLVPLVDPIQRLLALDVSSTACGWAVFDRKDDRLPFFDVIRPTASWVATRRIDAIVLGLGRVIEAHTPSVVVMEWASGKTHGRLRKATGLSVLGAAQGAVREFLRGVGRTVYTVTENEWTRSVPKRRRAMVIGGMFPAYAAKFARESDEGFDIADALGIGLWAYSKTNVTSPGAPAGGGA
jgi:hypothetical protein